MAEGWFGRGPQEDLRKGGRSRSTGSCFCWEPRQQRVPAGAHLVALDGIAGEGLDREVPAVVLEVSAPIAACKRRQVQQGFKGTRAVLFGFTLLQAPCRHAAAAAGPAGRKGHAGGWAGGRCTAESRQRARQYRTPWSAHSTRGHTRTSAHLWCPAPRGRPCRSGAACAARGRHTCLWRREYRGGGRRVGGRRRGGSRG